MFVYIEIGENICYTVIENAFKEGAVDGIGVIIDRIMEAIGNAGYDSGGQDEKVYRDEPIIMSAARDAEELPEKYREMKRIARTEYGETLGEWPLFYRQGKFMEDFSDSYEKEAYFMKYYPTYRQMSDRQLRTYFTWRTAVRAGEIKETSLSYAYVYLYELINLIGCADPAEALEKLTAFTEKYSEYDRSIIRFASRWAKDMRIYYGVSPEGETDPFDAASSSLSAPHDCGEDELFGAICTLSSFDLQKSKLYKTHPAEAKALVCRVYTAFSDYCGRARRQTLAERLFGKRDEAPYTVFPSAVFYDSKKGEDREYSPTPRRKYVYCNRRWTVSGYPEVRKKSTALGSLMRTVDSLIRPYFGMEATKPGKTVVTLGAIVEKECAAYFRELAEAEAGKIEFDFSKLGAIREAADETRERLTAEEDPFEFFEEEAAPETEEEIPEPVGILTPDEKEILKMILNGEDAASFAARRGTPLSVIVDSINEKLYDTLLDTALEYDGEVPFAVEDYESELKGIAGI